jgi:hypothetical protein
MGWVISVTGSFDAGFLVLVAAALLGGAALLPLMKRYSAVEDSRPPVEGEVRAPQSRSIVNSVAMRFLERLLGTLAVENIDNAQ